MRLLTTLALSTFISGLTACGNTRSVDLVSLRLEHHHSRLSVEQQLQQSHAADLHAYIDRNAQQPDISDAWIELIHTKGSLGDLTGAEQALESLEMTHPPDPVLNAARVEYAERVLACADADRALEVIKILSEGAYGYAHETRLIQNLATLLALRGDLEGARGCYEWIKRMSVYEEYPARFRSLEIFLNDLNAVGHEFPHFQGIAFSGDEFDTRSFRGNPLFIHFWRRQGSLNHDIEFLEALRLDYPNLEVISVNVGDPEEAVSQAVLKHAPEWLMFHDEDGRLAESLGITFMGLYVHEPKGILIDRNGRTAVKPGREGAIAMGLRALEMEAEPAGVSQSSSGTPSGTPDGGRAGTSVRQMKEAHTRAVLQARDQADRSYLRRLLRYQRQVGENTDAVRTCLEIMRTAKAVDDLAAAERAYEVFNSLESPGISSRAAEFAYARTMLTCRDAEKTKRLVYDAIGDRREREDLYILLELSAALSVLNDVDGAREAYEKVIEVTGGAGEATWRMYIEALDRVGKDLDHFQCEGLNGGTIDTRDYAGKLLLIDFWGSWCHACIREMPHAYEAFNRYRRDGFEVLGVVVRDTREKASAFLHRTGYSWDQVFDEDSSIANAHVVVGYPTTILVDREGRVRCTRTFGGGLEIALTLLINRELPPLH